MAGITPNLPILENRRTGSYTYSKLRGNYSGLTDTDVTDASVAGTTPTTIAPLTFRRCSIQPPERL